MKSVKKTLKILQYLIIFNILTTHTREHNIEEQKQFFSNNYFFTKKYKIQKGNIHKLNNYKINIYLK